MDWTTFLAETRGDLKDPRGTRFPDQLLYQWTKDAIRDYSNFFPARRSRVELEEVENSDGLIYDLPADLVRVLTVEAPKDTYLEPRQNMPGLSYRAGYTYAIEGEQLVLGQQPRGAVLLSYYAIHDIPSSEWVPGEGEDADPVLEIDEEFEFTVPDRDIELIRLYVIAKAHERMRANTARLDRFREGQKRDDNPLDGEVKDLMVEYYTKLYARIPGGARYLYRPGRER